MHTDKYKEYTPIDFLKDEIFLRWQLFDNKEDSLFWNGVMEENPKLAPVVQEAITLYKGNIRFNDIRLTQSEITESLDLLLNTISQKKKGKVRYMMLRIAAAAACIIAIASVTLFLLNKKKAVQDIATFAQTLPEVDLNSTDTRLIIAENKTVTLSNKQSTIQYNANAITADDNLILKEESSTYNQLITPYGKRSMITFSDGTKAWVNAGSKLVYPAQFSKEKREIYVDGEIYIEVMKDKTRPFVVKTRQMDIEVLGTKFNVSAYEADETKSIVLLSGSVSISSDKHTKAIVLKPNQMYSNLEDSQSVKNVDASIYALWIQGLYRFESENLGSIITRLERYYGIKIECDATAAKLKCSGKIELKDDLDTLLADLTRALPITYRKNGDGSYTIK